jgi:sugar phosphate isomerase/epimerase
MQLRHGLHLAYCTNVHPGEDWVETLRSLERWTLAVKERVSPKAPYAIGLRLSDLASRELAVPETLLAFQRWLEKHNCYIFTFNGFPFGRFHGARVKEQVYSPDWTDSSRLEYTNRLFDLLSELAPARLEGSVSTLPGSFKEFINAPEQIAQIQANLWRCVEHIARLSERTGRKFHLGLEPEPLGLFENSVETAEFFDRLRDKHPDDPRLEQHLGVNYDTCHFAVEYEEPADALGRLVSHAIRLSKIHVSNALAVRSDPSTLQQLKSFAEDVYLHQVIVRNQDGSLNRFKDLPLALAEAGVRPSPGAATSNGTVVCKNSNAPIGSGMAPLGDLPVWHQRTPTEEWRIHFHVPLQSELSGGLSTTASHILGLLDLLKRKPQLCSHLEMETYTWAVLPEPLKTKDVTEQLVAEYEWTLGRLAERGLADKNRR